MQFKGEKFEIKTWLNIPFKGETLVKAYFLCHSKSNCNL